MRATPSISDAEWEVMKVLWASGRATASQVVDALAPRMPWKPKTILTLLSRLVKKKAVGFERKGRAYEYFPLIPEADCVRQQSRTFLRRVFSGQLKPMLAHFLEHAELSQEDMQELKRMLEEGRPQ